MRDAVKLMAVWDKLGIEELAPSEVYRLLQPLNSASLEAVARINPASHNSVEWDRLHLYLTTLRYVKLTTTGDHLRKMGIEAGPIYREVLDALLDARLDGKVATTADEERFVREWLAGKNKKT
jgi:tRNA nucleotidyltransferase (CCA-adding enzyme)